MGNDLWFFELNTGAKIPSIGVGTYSTSPHILSAAIKLGYRHIDCAHFYGNEKQIGEVLKQVFEDGIVKREDLFITSKLWNYDHDPEDVPKALDRTLHDLQLEYLDLYLIHWPVKEKKGSAGTNPEDFLRPDIPSTWKAMEALYDSGRVRAIGVSNFSTKKLNDLLEVARIPPAVNQVECHPMWQQPKLHEFCRLKGIHLSAYSPLGSQFAEAKKKGLFADPVLNTVAEKIGKTPAQVALRWGLQMGHSVEPKTSNEVRLKENMDIFDWSIPEDLFHKLSETKQLPRQDEDKWLNHGGDLENRRYASKETKISPKTASNLHLKWKFEAESYTTATPAIYEGTLYVASFDGNIYAIKESDGSLVWKQNVHQLTGFNATGPLFNGTLVLSRTTPTIAGDLVIVGIYGPAVVLGLRRDTGELVWLTRLDSHPNSLITMSGTYYKRDLEVLHHILKGKSMKLEIFGHRI